MFESRYTGLFGRRDRVPARPHDPAVSVTAGELPPWRPGDPELGSGGCGWTDEAADAACLGEAVERVLARPLPGDGVVRTSFARRDFEAVAPGEWVLFHRDQYVRPGFPLEPLTDETVCDWVAMREADSGREVWVPAEFVYLVPGLLPSPLGIPRGEGSGVRGAPFPVPRNDESRRSPLTPTPLSMSTWGEGLKTHQRFLHGFSTGLSAGRVGDPVLRRGVQEVVERDGLVGAWWGRYPVEEWPADRVWPTLGDDLPHRLQRPNLTYRFYRVRSPFSSALTLVSLLGGDLEGEVFSVGSACRDGLSESWTKSLLEAVQGRHCVRRLMAEGRTVGDAPTTFLEHALYYSRHPERRARTVLERAVAPCEAVEPTRPVGPILFRLMTPPFADGWLVLRVVVPGLQPLHGDHRLPFLGGPLWGRPVADWAETPPHPFA